MPRPCPICQHPEREAIDRALAAKAPYREIAERFRTSLATLHRHKSAHTQPPAHTGPTGAQSSTVAPDPRAAALLDAAQRLQARASALRQHIVEVRSLHDPQLLARLEDLSCVQIEVTGLLTEILGLLAALPAGLAPSGR